MPWFVTPRVRYLHVPKTGGTWATSAMAAAGVPAMRPEPSPAHANLDESRAYGDRFTFAFVRHPLDYWRSYWAYRVRTGWDPDSQLDREAGSPVFEQFIERVIAVAPGAATELFDRFVGPPDAEIVFIGRYERLVDDVCLALRIAGERFDEARLRSFPKANVSDYSSRDSRYPLSLARRLAEVEHRGIERFYPWETIPPQLLARPIRRRRSDDISVGRALADLTVDLRNARAELDQTRQALAMSELTRDQAQRELMIARRGRFRHRVRRLRELGRSARPWRYRRPGCSPHAAD